jgi:hypothetical protein
MRMRFQLLLPFFRVDKYPNKILWVEKERCENQKRTNTCGQGIGKHVFQGEIVWSNAMYNSVENKRNQKEIHVNPDDVYSPRGRRLRFQLINSKFPAPLKFYLFAEWLPELTAR